MKKIAVGLLLLLNVTVASADLAESLRGLRGTIGDITSVNKTATDLFKSISTVTNGEVDKSVTLPKESTTSVILYRTEYCGYCKQAASYMQQKSIPFIEKDIEDMTN